MDDTALKEALKRLLAHGEAASDMKMLKYAESKKPKQPGQPLAMCAECEMEMTGGKCQKCDSELAELLGEE